MCYSAIERCEEPRHAEPRTRTEGTEHRPGDEVPDRSPDRLPLEEVHNDRDVLVEPDRSERREDAEGDRVPTEEAGWKRDHRPEPRENPSRGDGGSPPGKPLPVAVGSLLGEIRDVSEADRPIESRVSRIRSTGRKPLLSRRFQQRHRR